MNTVGKTLVILNFLFAVVVGAFLVVDFATRTSWKAEYEKQRQHFQVIESQRDQAISDASNQRALVKEKELEVENVKRALKDEEEQTKVKLAGLATQVEQAKEKAKDTDLTMAKMQTDIERLRASEAGLKDIVKEREKAVLELQESVKSFRTAATSSEMVARQVSDRNQALLKEVTDLGLKVQQLQASKSGTGAEGLIVRDTNQPNPPASFVKGKVEKVDPADSSLVQISVGTDQGVNKNNTMEVFRTSPSPKYLGMIRIVDAFPRNAIGRLVSTPGATRPQLQEGDNVWSRLK
jgi:hypothetical protein